MSEPAFDLAAYLDRIGLDGPLSPDIETLRAVVTAHCAAIPYENIDVLLGRPPKLDPASLQAKMVHQKRGGYCFEQNLLLRAALRALGFDVTGRIARVVRGLPADAPRLAAHMVVQIDMADASYLVDVGFGNLTPTGPIAFTPATEQITPHGQMRLLPVGSEVVLQARLGDSWENLWRLCEHLPLDADYDVANWFTATYPQSLFVINMIAARAVPDGGRLTFLNGQVNLRHPDGTVERQTLTDADAIADALAGTFGLELPAADVRDALTTLERLGRVGAEHRFFG